MDSRIKRARMAPASSPARDGFTLIEVLIAILFLGILVVTVLAPMTGLFGMSRDTNTQMATATQAQNVMEQVKGLWRDQGLYDRNCLKGMSFGTVTVSVTDLTTAYTPTGSASTPSTSASCDSAVLGSPFTPVPARRIVVTAGSGKTITTLQLDRDRPLAGTAP